MDGSLSDKEKKLKNRSQQILGAVLWLSTKTRPDLCYAHSRGASYVESNVHVTYSRSVQILLYLRENPFLGLKYSWYDGQPLKVYGDCSFSPTGRYSQEGNAAFIGSSLIDWRSKRQTLMAMSSCEG